MLLDYDFFDEISNDLGSFRWGAPECLGKTGRAIEHLPGLVAGYSCTEALEQPRRAGQRVGQNPDHDVFDFLGRQPPALSAIGSRFGDQGSGDVVAIAPALLGGVRWGEPLAPGIDQHTRQQARLGCIGLPSMVARIGSELIPNSGSGHGVDQRRMLSGVELALVGNLTGSR